MPCKVSKLFEYLDGIISSVTKQNFIQIILQILNYVYRIAISHMNYRVRQIRGLYTEVQWYSRIQNYDYFWIKNMLELRNGINHLIFNPWKKLYLYHTRIQNTMIIYKVEQIPRMSRMECYIIHQSRISAYLIIKGKKWVNAPSV